MTESVPGDDLSAGYAAPDGRPYMPHDDPEYPYRRSSSLTPQAAGEQVLRLWNDPALRGLATVNAGELDPAELAHIVSEKIAEARFVEAFAGPDEVTPSHPAYRRLQIARGARDQYERARDQRPL